ncbi:MAG TPA: DUF1844 domain-containing protein [Acidobacteriaceae bacterium]|nr:DUF1844 domain-containing protein [Acidobacteriaceae bacterium]
MSEKPPVFTVTDRRKFTLEGELREDAAAETPSAPAPGKPAEAKPEPVPGPRLVTPPSRTEPASKSPEPQPAAEMDQETAPDISQQEEAAAHHAYRQSSEHIDTMLRAANPASGAPPAVTFEHVIQSIYLSAIVALGAGTEPGQKARIDILGARQSVDMLGVLQEKTKGNLTDTEQRLLQNALFEARMMFLEVTNAIAQQAARPPQEKK